MKEGNLQEWYGEGVIGMISFWLILEGFIKKDKIFILVFGWWMYVDLLFWLIVVLANQQFEEDVKIKLYFYDFNVKLQYKFNDKYCLYFSVYLGVDVFFIDVIDDEDSFGGGIDWGNSIFVLCWNWQINNKFFVNIMLIYSCFQIDVIVE